MRRLPLGRESDSDGAHAGRHASGDGQAPSRRTISLASHPVHAKAKLRAEQRSHPATKWLVSTLARGGAAIHLRVKTCPAVSVTCCLINLGVGLLEQAGVIAVGPRGGELRRRRRLGSGGLPIAAVWDDSVRRSGCLRVSAARWGAAVVQASVVGLGDPPKRADRRPDRDGRRPGSGTESWASPATRTQRQRSLESITNPPAGSRLRT